jgi:SagB-type dehydrogenase family enzyme
LRVNPSSGHLHPMECYLLINRLHKKKSANYCAGQPMVCHYAPAEHALEIRAHVARSTWQALISTLPPSSFLIGLTSIYWREAWKYGARAYRYCQLDAGHALAALRLSAAVLGWRLVLIESIGDQALAELLGIDEQARLVTTERELPVLLAAVIPTQAETNIQPDLHTHALRENHMTTWHGQANKISARHVKWEIIEQVADACTKPHTPLFNSGSVTPPRHTVKEAPVSFHTLRSLPSAKRIICQRRSASALDGTTEISSSDFYSMLQLVLRQDGDGAPAARPPWDAMRGSACLHLCLFVHRVSGILPGLYILVREPCKLIELRSCMRADFAWEMVTGCPSSLPLYFLHSGDYQRIARLISCGQVLASDAAFSLAMVAEFERPLNEFGTWYYRHLFWEAGIIGQVLYLEAEVRGLRSTGLGCFLDDAVHQVLGFSGWQYQSLYNFAVGAAIEDARLSQSPAYDCEQRKLRKGSAIY